MHLKVHISIENSLRMDLKVRKWRGHCILLDLKVHNWNFQRPTASYLDLTVPNQLSEPILWVIELILLGK